MSGIESKPEDNLERALYLFKDAITHGMEDPVILAIPSVALAASAYISEQGLSDKHIEGVRQLIHTAADELCWAHDTQYAGYLGCTHALNQLATARPKNTSLCEDLSECILQVVPNVIERHPDVAIQGLMAVFHAHGKLETGSAHKDKAAKAVVEHLGNKRMPTPFDAFYVHGIVHAPYPLEKDLHDSARKLHDELMTKLAWRWALSPTVPSESPGRTSVKAFAAFMARQMK